MHRSVRSAVFDLRRVNFLGLGDRQCTVAKPGALTRLSWRIGCDFTRCLRASIAESDFIAYANRLDLTESYDAQNPRHARMHWPSCSETWWTPPKSLNGARIQLLRHQTYGTIRWMPGGHFVMSKRTIETAVQFLRGRVPSCLTDVFCSVVLSRAATTANAEQATNLTMHASARSRRISMVDLAAPAR